MPLAKITLIKGALSAEQKKEMMNKVSDAIASVEGEAIRRAGGIWVIIEETVNDGEWHIGPNGPLTIDLMQKLKAGDVPS